MTRSTKYTNLESLINETLFKDNDIVNLEIIKNFMKFKLDMEEFDIIKLLSHLKKFCDSKGNINNKQLNLALKGQSDNFYSTNPFENNFLADYKKQSVDPSMYR
jgi:hypothetical protein